VYGDGVKTQSSEAVLRLHMDRSPTPAGQLRMSAV